MKKCARCEFDKPLMAFSRRSGTKDGRAYTCKGCHKVENAKHYKATKSVYAENARRRREVNTKAYHIWKSTLQCCLCSEHEAVCLDFHHRDPKTKEFTIATKRVDFLAEHVQSELKKCVCICKNCHAKVHAGIKQLPK